MNEIAEVSYNASSYPELTVTLHSDGTLEVYQDNEGTGNTVVRYYGVPAEKRREFAGLFAKWVTTTRPPAVDDYVRLTDGTNTRSTIGSVLALAQGYAMVGWDDGRVTAERVTALERVIR